MKSMKSETFDELLAAHGQLDRVTAFAGECSISPETLRRIRLGIGNRGPCSGTVMVLALALGVSADRVRRAIDNARK